MLGGSLSNYAAVILAGGKGTRLGSATTLTPKPLLKLDDEPLLIHIMESYSQYGVRRFFILGGFQVAEIKSFFVNLKMLSQDVRVETLANRLTFLGDSQRDWDVTVIDTGLETQTAGRLLRAAQYLKDEPHFFLTYGDGLSSHRFDHQMAQHLDSQAIVTLTAVPPQSKFGVLKTEGKRVVSFREKAVMAGERVSGGYFCVSSHIFDFIEGEDSILETDVLPELSMLGKVSFFDHLGFWQCVDTPKDLQELQVSLSENGKLWIHH